MMRRPRPNTCKCPEPPKYTVEVYLSKYVDGPYVFYIGSYKDYAMTEEDAIKKICALLKCRYDPIIIREF
jgi:hypothetical protein